MRFRISENERLKRALQEAYFSRESADTGEDRQFQIMGRVRRAGPLKTSAWFLPAFENLVWRIAPACCLLLLTLTVLFTSMDLDHGYDYPGALAAEMERPTLPELYGLEGWE